MKWLRLYEEVLDDPKVQKLHPALFKHWINLLCLASQQKERGTLPGAEVVAFRLRVRPTDAEHIIEQLTAVGLLEVCESGARRHHNWAGRQRTSDDVAARVRKHRQSALDKEGENGRPPVTLRATLPTAQRNGLDTDTESERESSTPDGVAPALDAPADPAPVAALQDAEPASQEPPVRAVPKPKRERAPGHAAVRLYRRATDINPKEGVRQQIEEAIDAEDEEALGRWQHVLQEWLSRGYSSKNVAGLLDWFREGVPQRKRPAGVTNGPPGGSSERGYVPNPGPPPVEWDDAKAAASAAARERTRQELVGSGVLTGRRAPPAVPGVNGTAKAPPDAATTEQRLAERERRLLANGVLTEDQIATARRARHPAAAAGIGA